MQYAIAHAPGDGEEQNDQNGERSHGPDGDGGHAEDDRPGTIEHEVLTVGPEGAAEQRGQSLLQAGQELLGEMAEKDRNRQAERHTELGAHVPGRGGPEPIGDQERNAEKNRWQAEPESLEEDRSEYKTGSEPSTSHRDLSG